VVNDFDTRFFFTENFLFGVGFGGFRRFLFLAASTSYLLGLSRFVASDYWTVGSVLII